jgi:hypothetical protein
MRDNEIRVTIKGDEVRVTGIFPTAFRLPTFKAWDS